MTYRLLAPLLLLSTYPVTEAFADGQPSVKNQAAKIQPELGGLKSQAERVTKEISALTASGTLPTNDESLALLKRMVDELSSINEKLKNLQDTTSGGTAKPAAKATAATAAGSKLAVTGYLQFQYFATDKKGASQFDAFRLRRARLNFDAIIDPRLSARATAEFASGNGQNEARLRDAFITYDLSPVAGAKVTRAIAGQMLVPLGFEIGRADTEREFPERALYNTTLFAGERIRGVQVRHSLGSGWEVFGGAFNAMSIDDPEQVNLAAGTGNTLAGTGGIRKTGKNFTVGASGLVGKRPDYVSTSTASPNSDRQFLYLDGMLSNLLPKLTLRGEAMVGHDRIPKATAVNGAEDHPLSGFQAQARYDFDVANALTFRWEQFDPNLSKGGNLVNGYGLSFVHQFGHNLRFTLAHEIFSDESRISGFDQRQYGQTTVRLQVKF